MTTLRILRVFAAALLPLLCLSYTLPADAACKTARCRKVIVVRPKVTAARPRNVVLAPGAQHTKFGVIAPGAKQTSFGVMKGQKKSFGVIAPGAHTTSYGVTRGTQTQFGVIAPGAKRTSFGVLGGQKTNFGAMGSNCRKTPFGVRCSDRRLKRDLVLLRRLDNGIGLYRFRYKWSDTLYVGVVAQEVAAAAPAAVTRGSDGYLRVDYRRIGLRLKTWGQWSASQRASHRDCILMPRS